MPDVFNSELLLSSEFTVFELKQFLALPLVFHDIRVMPDTFWKNQARLVLLHAHYFKVVTQLIHYAVGDCLPEGQACRWYVAMKRPYLTSNITMASILIEELRTFALVLIVVCLQCRMPRQGSINLFSTPLSLPVFRPHLVQLLD